MELKRLRINAGYAGLVFRKGDYLRVVTEGKHKIGFKDEVLIYDLTKPFVSRIDLNIFLRDSTLAEHLIVVEVADSEIALQYENGNYKNVLPAGRYAFWKGVTDYKFVKLNLSEINIPDEFDRTLLKKGTIMPYIRKFVIESYEKGIMYIDGKFKGILDTGTYYFWKNEIQIDVMSVDLRQKQIEISGQEMLTKDKATLRVNFVAQYKVIDIEKALIDIKDYEKQLYVSLQLALREFIGTYSLDEMLEKKDGLSEYVMKSVKDKAVAIGVTVVDCGIRDIILPGEMKDIMNQVLIAQKKAQANVIMRREETASTRSLLNTAKLMEDSEMLFKLKEMEYVEKIADKINNISLSGGSQVLTQLKDIFSVK